MMIDHEIDISKLTFEQVKKIRGHLKLLIENGGSDLHVKANGVIRARIDGKIKQFAGKVYTYDDAMTLAKEILRSRFKELMDNKEVDLVYQYDEHNRFRVNIFFQTDGPSFVFRHIPMEVPSLSDQDYPDAIKEFTYAQKGMVLVTGATGSGKSTTLAAMLDEINRREQKHIITIEDPIEFVHKDRGCIVNQRSVGQDTLSYDRALRAALREDPDIILVGEIRDRDTVDLALHAADTGHLVFSTLHTIDAKETINRIVAMFPNDEQNRIRLSLSGVLKGVVSQRLLPKIARDKDGKILKDEKTGQVKEYGRVAAYEILVNTPTVGKLIKDNRDDDIPEAIEKGRKHYGSQSFDQHLLDIYNEGLITRESALDQASVPADLKLQMNGFDSAKTMSGRDASSIVIDDDVFELKE